VTQDHVIKKFEHCDFAPIRAHLEQQKMLKKAATDAEREKSRAEKEEIVLKHSFAIVDGHVEKVGNTTVEPPGLFRGRGKHPKTGKLKQRVYPDQVRCSVLASTSNIQVAIILIVALPCAHR
jgi:DNA topoisomerase-1